MTTLDDLILDTRQSAEDHGNTTTDNFDGDGSTTIWRLSSPPIGTDTDTVTVAAADQTRGTDYTVNYDRGEITFTSAPANGAAVVIQYTHYIWRSERVKAGLNAGIRRMFPSLYKLGELYILLRQTVYDYDLTNTTDVPEASSFTDQTMPADYVAGEARTDIVKAQTRVHFAEYRRNGANQVYVPYETFRRTTPRNFHMDTDPNTNDVLRLTYTAPFTVLVNGGDETDVPDEFYDLPVWYALSTLNVKKETKRARSDSYATMQNTNANRPGTHAAAADDYRSMYMEFLRDNAMRPMRMTQRRQLRPWESGR